MPDWSRMTNEQILAHIGQNKEAEETKISVLETRFREIQRKTKICDFQTFLAHAKLKHSGAIAAGIFDGDWLKFADMMITVLEVFEAEK